MPLIYNYFNLLFPLTWIVIGRLIEVDHNDKFDCDSEIDWLLLFLGNKLTKNIFFFKEQLKIVESNLLE